MHDVSVVGADPAIDYEIDMDIPEGAAYCALSHYASAGAAQPYIKLSFKVGEETVLSSLKGKVINVLGDSITSVDYTLPNWWQKIAERTGARFNNYGVSSTSIAVRSGRTDSFLERADQMDVNADAVFIMGGTNDSNALIGEWNSTDTTTFFGALNALFPKICEKFPGKPIIVATPIQSTATYPSIQLNAVALVEKVLNAYKDDPTKQSDWWILQTRAECIKLKAAQYGLPCLDLFYTSGINGADSGKIYYRPNDTLHPSAYGQERLAVLIQAELEKHFH
jgi:lysophospholipase L1-like esterase